MNQHPIIWTNMRFWQSPLWRQRVQSIYPLPEGENDDAEPILPVWRQVYRLLRHRRSSDVIVTMGVRESMLYALVCALLFRPPKQVMMEIFLDSPSPRNPLWRIKTWAYGWLARRAIGMITNSSGEMESLSRRFRLPREQLRFVPLCSTLQPDVIPEPPVPCVLAAGRTLRDFPLLLKVAEQLPDVPFQIICGADDLLAERVPDNVTILREVPQSVYIDQLKAAQWVVVPLLPTPRSTGQVVLLEAMALGKPVVATRSAGTIDYIRDGETGFLVEPGEAADMLRACQQLAVDAKTRQTMGVAARTYVEDCAQPDRYAREFLNVIEEWIRMTIRGAQ